MPQARKAVCQGGQHAPAPGAAGSCGAGPQFTCFTSTKVQILTRSWYKSTNTDAEAGVQGLKKTTLFSGTAAGAAGGARGAPSAAAAASSTGPAVVMLTYADVCRRR